MKKWILITILMVVMVQTAYACIECQISTDNTTWNNIENSTYDGVVDDVIGFASIQNIDIDKIYYVRCKNSTTDWGYISQRTEDGFGMLMPIVFGLSIFSIFFIILGIYLATSGNKESLTSTNLLNFDREPKIDFVSVIGYGLVYLGVIILLYVLHIIGLNTDGATQSAVHTLFKIFIPLSVASLIFGLVALTYKLLKWATWLVVTPNWMKAEARGKQK